MPTSTPIAHTEAEIAAVSFDDAGLVAAIVQEESTGAVLMVAWMNEESLRKTLETGRTWFWSRRRQEFWCKGETSGDRQYVREAFYDCDADTSPVRRRAGGPRRVPHGRALVLLPGLRLGRHPGPLRRRERPTAAVDRAEFRALARDHTVVPVWREVLADLETPVSAFLKIVGDGEGFLLESVEHAERWGRFSFIGRDPVGHADRPRRRRQVRGRLPAGVPTDAGALAAIEALLAHHRAPQLGAPAVPRRRGRLPGLRRRARGRAPARRAARRLGWPDAVMSASPATSPRSTTSASGSS